MTTPHENLEVTPEAQRRFNGITSGIESKNGAAMDPFQDDTPITCGIENPESCESCQ